MASSPAAATISMDITSIGRPPLPEPHRASSPTTSSVAQRPKICRASTFSDDSLSNAEEGTPPPTTRPFEAFVKDRGSRRMSRLARSLSFDTSQSEVDTSHIEGIKRREVSIRSLAMIAPEQSKKRDLAPPQKPQRTDGGFSAEEIALRRFMTLVAWGSGLPVLKHNRRRGKIRRVLRFNDQEGCLSWSGTLPPYHKTRVPTEQLQGASRNGLLVTLKIASQGDVGFQCARLTEAIVLQVGLNNIIRACKAEALQ